MRSRVGIWCLVLTMLGFADVACAQRSGGVLRIFHRDNPVSASILEESAISTVVAFMPVFNNLVVFDPTKAQNTPDDIVPDLAESWSWNEDKTEITFRLRKNVRWHDGFPFTSSDVECTFNLWTGRARNRLRTNPRATWFNNVNYVRAPNDDEVTVYLNRPQPAFLSMLASGLSPIYPCHVPLAQMRSKPIGTGPFKLASFNEFDRIRLVRNPDYWKKGRPYLDAIEFHVVASRSTALLSFVAGRYDMTFPNDVSMTQLRDVRRQSTRVSCEATGTNSHTNILLNRDKAPFDNPDVRKALSLALDREAFVEAFSEGSGMVGGHLQPPPDGLWGLPTGKLEAVPGFGGDREQNLEDARNLMRKAGYGPDRMLPLKIFTRAVSLYRSPAATLASQLNAIFIDASLDVSETSYWYTRLARRDYALAIETTANGVDDPDQAFYENFSCRSERNYSRYCNPEIERLFETQSSELDTDKRREMAWEIDLKLLADVARPPIIWNKAATCWQPYVRGYMPQVNSSYNAFRFEDVWLDRR